MSDKQDTAKTSWFRKGNRKVITLATGTAIAIGGVFGVQALANSQTYAHMKLYAGYNGGGHGGHHKGFADISDAEIEARIERMVKHAAIEIDATQEQQEKITALVTAVAMDLKPVHDRMRAAGKEIHDLLMADTIDRDALEKLRAERLAEAELISKNLVSALADVAEVLSPEQRKLLDERIKKFRSKHRGGHRG
ncbi:MAG: periplasmic heavy metal sensor [Proteobacteria bacterium]|nr:periplasmic heavy metal sensor [Pseudomonadota bacterium]